MKLLPLALVACVGVPATELDAGAPPDAAVQVTAINVTATLVAAKEAGISCTFYDNISLTVRDLDRVAYIDEAAPPIPCQRVTPGERLGIGCHRIRSSYVAFWDWLEFDVAPDGGTVRWTMQTAAQLWCSGTYSITAVKLNPP